MTRRALLTTVLALLAAALGSGLAGAAEDSYTLSIQDHRFTPSEIDIPADRKITLVVRNLDATPEEFESTELRREKVVAGGQQITVFIGPLRPGRYEFFGDFNPETARGYIVAK